MASLRRHFESCYNSAPDQWQEIHDELLTFNLSTSGPENVGAEAQFINQRLSRRALRERPCFLIVQNVSPRSKSMIWM